MKCMNCGKTIDLERACRCARCGKSYCPECAEKAVLCDCLGGFVPYD